MGTVAWLESEHGFGQVHSNAIVAFACANP